MTDRFYAPVAWDGPTVALGGQEAHHLRDVLRLRAGGEVVLFDGNGTEASAEIVTVSKSAVELRVLETRRDSPDGATGLILGVAVPKGERLRWLIEKSTELGVERLVPLNTARSVVEPRETRLEKLRQTVIAACKQSGRNRLMGIDAPTPWDDFVERFDRAGTFFVADPSGEPLSSAATGDRPTETVVLAVGPEGGFTRPELDRAAAAGAHVVSLGRHILRIETAAVAMASFLALVRRTANNE